VGFSVFVTVHGPHIWADWKELDDQGNAGQGEGGVGAAGAAIPEGAEESAAARGVVAGDAIGVGDSGGPNCESRGSLDEDGFPDGAVGAEEDDQPTPTGKDGAGGGMRHGVWVGAVGAVAGRPGAGDGGAGAVEEAVYEEIGIREQKRPSVVRDLNPRSLRRGGRGTGGAFGGVRDRGQLPNSRSRVDSQ